MQNSGRLVQRYGKCQTFESNHSSTNGTGDDSQLPQKASTSKSCFIEFSKLFRVVRRTLFLVTFLLILVIDLLV